MDENNRAVFISIPEQRTPKHTLSDTYTFAEHNNIIAYSENIRKQI